MEVITLPSGEKYATDWSTRDIDEIITKCCGRECADVIMKKIEDLAAAADYTKAKLNTDLEAYEGDIECLRSTLTDINETIDEYTRNLENGNTKFSRKTVLPMLDNITTQISNVL